MFVKFCQYLNEGGFVIVSGILKSQINDIVIHYGKLNLKLIKYNYINEWASIIFKNMTKNIKKIKELEDIIQNKGVDYYLISTTDEFLNEYVPEHCMRLKWLTNFLDLMALH